MSLMQRAARTLGAFLTAAGLLVSTPALASDLASDMDRATTATALPSLPAMPPALEAPKVAFASLAEAVAAQDGLAEDEHLRCLASAVYFESQGQPLAGQLAVAQVILNRAKSGRFAPDVCGVVKQRGQFGFVRGGQIPAVPEGRATWRTAIAVAKVALAEAWDPPVPGALYFNGVRAAKVGGKRLAVIGGHAFYR